MARRRRAFIEYGNADEISQIEAGKGDATGEAEEEPRAADPTAANTPSVSRGEPNEEPDKGRAETSRSTDGFSDDEGLVEEASGYLPENASREVFAADDVVGVELAEEDTEKVEKSEEREVKEEATDVAGPERRVALPAQDGPDRVNVVLAVIVGIGLLAAILGALMFWQDSQERDKYDTLAQTASSTTTDSASDDENQTGIDWAALKEANGRVCAWLSVDGTSIDLPVVHATEDDPDRYLTHDFWGAASKLGCPYLNWQCSEIGNILTVYGHDMWSGGGMFTELGFSYRAKAFEGIGSATWATELHGTTTFTKLCALSVNMHEGNEWNKTGFKDENEMRDWLRRAVTASGATVDGAEAQIASAKRTLVLVTCDHATSDGSKRTLTVFTA